MSRRLSILPPLLALSALGVLLFAQVRFFDVFAAARHLVFDAYMAIAPYRPGDLPLTLVMIDEASLARHGAWPWPEPVLAGLVERLAAAGPGLLVLAFVPTEAAGCPADPSAALGPNLPESPATSLARALASTTAVIGFALTDEGGTSARPETGAGLALLGEEEPRLRYRLSRSLLPGTGAMAAAAGAGALNVFPDPDGRVRRVPLLVQMDGHLLPTLIAETLRVATNANTYLLKHDPDGIPGTPGLPLSLKIGPLVTGLDANAEIWLRYAERDRFERLSAAQVLEGSAPVELLRDRILIVGVAAAGIGGFHASALGEPLFGLEVQAQALAQLMEAAQPVRPLWALGAEVVTGAAVSLLLVLLSLWRRGWWLVLPGTLLLLALFAGGFFLYRHHLLLLDALSPALTVAAVFAVLTSSRYLITERERRFVERAFSSLVSPNLVDYLVKHPDQLRLKGEWRECSFVMTDLAGFTPMVERFPPEALVDMLNDYLDAIIAIVFRHEGTLERIVGDAVSVHFSAPVVQPDHAQRALDCALSIDRFAADFAARMRAREIPFGDTRIGVHTGAVIVGNFGGRQHLDYRAFGDPINTVARLEAANKHFGTRIALSAATLAQCRPLSVRPIGRLRLKGKTRAIETFTPLSPEDTRSGLAAAYAAAYHLVEQGDAGAEAAFEACAARFGDDGLAVFHLERLRSGRTGVVIALEK